MQPGSALDSKNSALFRYALKRKMEGVTRLELATSSLARRCSTTELHPRFEGTEIMAQSAFSATANSVEWQRDRVVSDSFPLAQGSNILFPRRSQSSASSRSVAISSR